MDKAFTTPTSGVSQGGLAFNVEDTKRNLYTDMSRTTSIADMTTDESDDSSSEDVRPQVGDTLSSFVRTTDAGQWHLTEVLSGNRGTVTFEVTLNGEPIVGLHGNQDKLSFSLGTASCAGETVHLDRFQLPIAKRHKGTGTKLFKLMIEIYREAGCAVLDVPAANVQGTRLYKKCGLS